MKHGKTAVYTILKNECKNIERWLYYADPFDYKVLLDTGSTDGSWELLQEFKDKDPKLIIEQKIFTPWHFSNARNYNMTMIPDEVVWCLSPDLDEFFSINTHDEMEKIIEHVPHITNIACDRMDIYSSTVRVGPPNHLPTNKIHRRVDYKWVQPIYEHLIWKYDDREECELYSDDIFLIHDQDFKSKTRPELYIKMLEEEYRDNPSNNWCLWFYLYHLTKSQQKDKYIEVGCVFLNNCMNTSDKSEKYNTIKTTINDIFANDYSITREQRELIFNTLTKK